MAMSDSEFSEIIFTKDLPQSPLLHSKPGRHTIEQFRHAPRSLFDEIRQPDWPLSEKITEEEDPDEIDAETVIGLLRQENLELLGSLRNMKEELEHSEQANFILQRDLSAKLNTSDDLILQLRSVYYQQIQLTMAAQEAQRTLATRLRESELERRMVLQVTQRLTGGSASPLEETEEQNEQLRAELAMRSKALLTLEERQHQADLKACELEWNRVNGRVMAHFDKLFGSTDDLKPESVSPEEALRTELQWTRQQLENETERCMDLGAL
ncbi:hypothetical protein CLU79DRAFT_751105 [Phycomyces nitens]|nr:hypothetical protein CLU79DRAFT_751105 [Phycomyces nitens]